MMPNPEAMLTPREIAAVLNVSLRHAQMLCERGKIPAKNVGLGNRHSTWRAKLCEVTKFRDGVDNCPMDVKSARESLPPHIRRFVG